METSCTAILVYACSQLIYYASECAPIGVLRRLTYRFTFVRRVPCRGSPLFVEEFHFPNLEIALFVEGNLPRTKLEFGDDNVVESKDDLNASTFETYVYLVKTGKPVGPRDVMRGANLSSPSVAYRNLQKLLDLGLVVKDEYGNYVVKEKVALKGQVWLGKTLVPRFMIFGFIFVGIVITELVILFPHLLVGASVEGSFWLLTIVTVVSAAIFLIEGLRFRKKKSQR
jgi:hypothetical protein